MNPPYFLVTGATDGIGFETAAGLAAAGHPVLVHGRSPAGAQDAVHRLTARHATARLEPVAADFSRLDEVRALVSRLGGRPLAGLIHNAGTLQKTRTLTEDGWETTWQVNHLAPFLVHFGLAGQIVAGGREVWVSSMLHGRGTIPFDDLNGDRSFDGVQAYNNSKLANALMALRTGRTVSAGRLGSFALHPGVVATKVLRRFGMTGGAAPEAGARTSLFAALDPSLTGRTGLYLDDARVGQVSPAARDEELQDRLWTWTVRALALG